MQTTVQKNIKAQKRGLKIQFVMPSNVPSFNWQRVGISLPGSQLTEWEMCELSHVKQHFTCDNLRFFREGKKQKWKSRTEWEKEKQLNARGKHFKEEGTYIYYSKIEMLHISEFIWIYSNILVRGLPITLNSHCIL